MAFSFIVRGFVSNKHSRLHVRYKRAPEVVAYMATLAARNGFTFVQIERLMFVTFWAFPKPPLRRAICHAPETSFIRIYDFAHGSGQSRKLFMARCIRQQLLD